MTTACDIRIRGVVQGVGFRPFIYRLAHSKALNGWVSNGGEGVEIHLEGSAPALEEFVRSLKEYPPPAAGISTIHVETTDATGLVGFAIRESQRTSSPTVQISPDLPVCPACLAELFDPANRRYGYSYINCTNCGPRYSVIQRLPYDRANTTMQPWPMDDYCDHQYHNPGNRRFHAQPVACPVCGPQHRLHAGNTVLAGDDRSIAETARRLRAGALVAIKGMGGYHLACDARNEAAVRELRHRKYRKEKPFALMVKNSEVAGRLVELSPAAQALLVSPAAPIVLAKAKLSLPGIAPENDDLGVMLPYTPLHHLLFAAGAPEVLVMTSANRSSEPIAFEDEDAVARLSGIADAFLIGQRPIARRVDDSIARAGAFGPVILRRSRGYAPSAAAAIPSRRHLLALGADLKNTITLVVDGQAFVSQHIGDLDQYQSFESFRATIHDLTSMYGVSPAGLILAHDTHPQYLSSLYALEQSDVKRVPVQHHRAHVASVIAERGAWDKRVLGVSFDGTGYGDDGAIWGGEFFAGSVIEGFERVAHLRPVLLPGGDAAARHPVQAAAGFLAQIETTQVLTAQPFCFSRRYEIAVQMLQKGLRTFTATSVGRLFDAAAAVLGFTREAAFEGQGAMWVEHLARSSPMVDPYPFPMTAGSHGNQLDFRPLLEGLFGDRLRGRAVRECARAFQHGLAEGLWNAAVRLCEQYRLDTVVLSGGVFQNELLLEDLKSLCGASTLAIWTNHAVPPNDGGISLGQAALAAFANRYG